MLPFLPGVACYRNHRWCQMIPVEGEMSIKYYCRVRNPRYLGDWISNPNPKPTVVQANQGTKLPAITESSPPMTAQTSAWAALTITYPLHGINLQGRRVVVLQGKRGASRRAGEYMSRRARECVSCRAGGGRISQGRRGACLAGQGVSPAG